MASCGFIKYDLTVSSCKMILHQYKKFRGLTDGALLLCNEGMLLF